MKIINILKRKKTLSFEFFPPKTEEEFAVFINTIRELKRYNPDFVSVTDFQISAKMKHIALSKFIKEKFNINPLVHLTCINNTSKEIKNSLKAITDMEIFNILALRGDRRNFLNVSSEFNHATDLLRYIPRNRFSIAVTAHPEGHPEGNAAKEIYYLNKKIELGADYAITQIFFDNKVFLKFRDRLKKIADIPVVCGIIALTSVNMLENILSKTGKIKIPRKLKNIIDKNYSKDDFIKYSTDFFTYQIMELKMNGVDGIHFFTFNRAMAVKRILNNIKKS